MFYFQKMKSVLKCLSLSLCLSHPFLPLIPPLPYSPPFLPRQEVTNFLVRSKPL